jgi:hypothetical protein
MKIKEIFKYFLQRGKKIKRITLGICAMAKKAESKPMREILSRLPEELFDIKYFGTTYSIALLHNTF